MRSLEAGHRSGTAVQTECGRTKQKLQTARSQLEMHLRGCTHVIQEPVFEDGGDALIPATFGGDFGRGADFGDRTLPLVGLVAKRSRERRKKTMYCIKNAWRTATESSGLEMQCRRHPKWKFYGSDTSLHCFVKQHMCAYTSWDIGDMFMYLQRQRFDIKRIGTYRVKLRNMYGCTEMISAHV